MCPRGALSCLGTCPSGAESKVTWRSYPCTLYLLRCTFSFKESRPTILKLGDEGRERGLCLHTLLDSVGSLGSLCPASRLHRLGKAPALRGEHTR